jgi:hypothetical protein
MKWQINKRFGLGRTDHELLASDGIREVVAVVPADASMKTFREIVDKWSREAEDLKGYNG